eukprot:5499144-Amphidinium_carterae.2
MGFGLQILACPVPNVKLTMQGVLLPSAGFKLDPLSYVGAAMHVCSLGGGLGSTHMDDRRVALYALGV